MGCCFAFCLVLLMLTGLVFCFAIGWCFNDVFDGGLLYCGWVGLVLGLVFVVLGLGCCLNSD